MPQPPTDGRPVAASPDDRPREGEITGYRKNPMAAAEIDEAKDEDGFEQKDRLRRSTKRSESTSQSNLPLRLSMAAAAALLAFGGVLIYLFVFTGDSEPVTKGKVPGSNAGSGLGGNNGLGNLVPEDHLIRVPANADFVASVDIQGIKAKLPQQFVESLLNRPEAARIQKQLGVPSSAIARVTAFGTSSVFFERNGQPVIMATSLQPLSFAALRARSKKPPIADGLFQLDRLSTQFLTLLSDHTLAIGSRPDLLTLKQGVSSKPNPICAKGIALAKQGEHLVVAGQVPSGMVSGLMQSAPAKQQQQFGFLAKLKDFTLSANLGKTARLNGTVIFSDAEAANQAKLEVDSWLNFLKLQLNQPQKAQNATQKQLFAMAVPILNQIQSKADAGQLTINLSASQSKVVSAVQLMEAEYDRIQNMMLMSNDLKQIGVAMHTYHSYYKSLPQPSFNKGLSWRVKLLPFLGQKGLYDQFNLNEPWDSPNNRELLNSMPNIYKHPSAKAKPGYTFFQVTMGPGGLFPSPNTKVKNLIVPDGMSNTFLVVEAKQAVPWTAPKDLSAKDVQFGAMPDSETFHALFVDGTVHLMPVSTPADTLRAFITPNGGETVTWPR